MKCPKCPSKDYPEDEIHGHHIVPKFMDGTDKEGILKLCKKHHDILHLIIPKIIWKYVPKEAQGKCKEEIKRFTTHYTKSSKVLNFFFENDFMLDEWAIRYLERRDLNTAIELFNFNCEINPNQKIINKELVDKFEEKRDDTNTKTITEP